MYDHIAEAMKAPSIVRLSDNVAIARFEVLKLYSVLAAVRSLLDSGRISRGDTLIESSSGVYAYSLAMACHRYGLRCHIVGSPAIDRTLLAILRILDVEVDLVVGGDDIQMNQRERVEKVHQVVRSRPDVYWMRQYHDDIHYLGYEEVAQMVAAELGVAGLTVVGGVGSGASTGGLVTYLRRMEQDVELVGVQPFGSITFGDVGGSDGQALLAGIGSGIPFENVKHELYDRVHWLSYEYAAAGTRALLADHAVFAGLSSGGAYLVAAWEASQNRDRQHLFIAADTGHRYLSQVYSAGHAIRLSDLAPRHCKSDLDTSPPWAVRQWSRTALGCRQLG
jgi:cysteine synthase A